MKKNIGQSVTADKTSNKTQKQTNRMRQKYNLILSIAELKKPVLEIVQMVLQKDRVKMTAEKQNQSILLVDNQEKLISKQRCRSSLDDRSNIHIEENAQEHRKDRSCYKKSNDKKSFSTKVNQLFGGKKYSYADRGNDEDNIDRLNAKLDKYISRYLGHQKLRQLRLTK